GHSGRRQRARGRGPVVPGAATCRRALARCATVAVQYNIATVQTGLGPALVFRPPADTRRVLACRRAQPQALPALWSSPAPRRERCTGARLAGYAQASLAGS